MLAEVAWGSGRGGSLESVPSKSHMHRIMICRALAEEEPMPQDGDLSDVLGEDLRATERCLSELLRCLRSRETPVFDCKESGSTLRFMMPIAAALLPRATFRCSEGLFRRPVYPLPGLTRDEAALSYHVEGSLVCGDYHVPGDVSSQFTGGLLFALPLLEGDSRIITDGEPQSRGYIRMTLDCLARFGISVEERGSLELFIPGGQKYAAAEIRAEGDWSAAAFWIAAAAVGHFNVAVRGLSPHSTQGDRVILDIAARMGARTDASKAAIFGTNRLMPINVDASDIPDLVPCLALMCSTAQGVSTISGCGRLRFKESDRLISISRALSDVGADIRIRGDALVINGVPRLAGGRASSFGDHRVAMMLACASAAAAAPIEIEGAEHVAKSYPTFFDDFRRLGGEVKFYD